MPVMEYQRSSSSPISSGHSLLSLSDSPAMPWGVAANVEALVAFQYHVDITLQELLPAGETVGDAAAVAAAAVGGDEFLSVTWIQRLLDGLITSQEKFRALVAQARRSGELPAGDNRMVADFDERAIKALDICNAAFDGVDRMRRWVRVTDIAASVLRAPGQQIREGQLRRARKALSDLSMLLADDTADSGTHGAVAGASWSVPTSTWSAAKTLKAIGAGLDVPPAHQAGSLAAPARYMGCVLHLAAWALVVAVPCSPDRASALQAHHLAAAQLRAASLWAPALLVLQQCLDNELKDRRNSRGLLKEIRWLERSTQRLAEAIDAAPIPLSGDRETEVREAATELAAVCEAMREGLGQLEKKVREVFRSIARSLTEGLDSSMNNAAVKNLAGSAPAPDDTHEEYVVVTRGTSVSAATPDDTREEDATGTPVGPRKSKRNRKNVITFLAR